MDAMMTQTSSFTLPSVTRSNVMPNEVLLQTAARIEKVWATCPKNWIRGMLAGSMAKACFPKPSEMLTVTQTLTTRKAAY